MALSDKRWKTIRQSDYPWEREALEFVRQGLPDREPYYAWSLFEFVAQDGSIAEVDLLLLSPVGFFMVEIKSRPGRVSGDAQEWVWTSLAPPANGPSHTLSIESASSPVGSTDGAIATTPRDRSPRTLFLENPLLLTNPELLFRYRRLSFLERVRELTRRPYSADPFGATDLSKLSAVLILLPGDSAGGRLALQGQVLPSLSWEVGELVKPWVLNAHRSGDGYQVHQSASRGREQE